VVFVMFAHISSKSDELSRAATQSWLWLAALGGAIALFTLLGTWLGLRELGSGLLHYYQTCRGVLESQQQFVSAVVSTISLVAFVSTGIGILSCIRGDVELTGAGGPPSRSRPCSWPCPI